MRQGSAGVLEALARSAPRNEFYRSTLKKEYEVAGSIAGDLNDFNVYLQMRSQSQKLDLENPQETAEFWRLAGMNDFDISSAQDLKGQRDAAAQSRRDAIDLLQRSRRLAQTAVSAAAGKNLAALKELVYANEWIGFVTERSGDLQTALEYRRDALAHARELASADPRTATTRELLANSVGAVARVQSLVDSRLPAMQLEVARGWRYYSWECGTSSAYACLDETLKSVEIDRALVGESQQAEMRLSLALDLESAGQAYLRASHSGSARQAALQRSRAAYTESREIFTELQRTGTLPNADQPRIAAITGAIDNVDAKLAQAQVSTTPGSR